LEKLVDVLPLNYQKNIQRLYLLFGQNLTWPSALGRASEYHPSVDFNPGGLPFIMRDSTVTLKEVKGMRIKYSKEADILLIRADVADYD